MAKKGNKYILEDKTEFYQKELQFVENVNNVLVNKKIEKKQIEDIENYFSPHLCPDQYVGPIYKLRFEKRDFYERINVFRLIAEEVMTIKKEAITEKKEVPITKEFLNIINNEDNYMIMILESPHREEFDKNRNPLGLAIGTTGENIRQYILGVFKERIEHFENYHLILLNAIPFQCSLGVKTETFRDDIFDAAWKDNLIGLPFFKNRLGSLLNVLQEKTVVIVNACTQGRNRKKKVRAAIKEITSDDIMLLKTPHPAYWHIKKNQHCEDDI